MKEIINQWLFLWTPLGDYSPLDPWHTFYIRKKLSPNKPSNPIYNATSKALSRSTHYPFTSARQNTEL